MISSFWGSKNGFSLAISKSLDICGRKTAFKFHGILQRTYSLLHITKTSNAFVMTWLTCNFKCVWRFGSRTNESFPIFLPFPGKCRIWVWGVSLRQNIRHCTRMFMYFEIWNRNDVRTRFTIPIRTFALQPRQNSQWMNSFPDFDKSFLGFHQSTHSHDWKNNEE